MELRMQLINQESDTCSICLDSLCGKPLGVLCDAHGCRQCLHYFHLDCLRKVEGAQCPQCRLRFFSRTPFPRIQEDVEEWFNLVSVGGKRRSRQDVLSKKDVSAALRSMLVLPSVQVDVLVESSWPQWTPNQSLRICDLARLLNTIAQHMPQLQLADPATSSSDRESSPHSPVTKSRSGSGHHFGKDKDGHSRSGVVCKCGQIHVRRGDRVRRGVAPQQHWEIGMLAGVLGTIARVGPGQETVVVKWDRTVREKTHTYLWPDPDGLVLVPASFTDVAEDTVAVQKQTGLSSFAAEELLRRSDFDIARAAEAFQASDCRVFEKDLRRLPKLYHHVRILPDSVLVQQWFDTIPPCNCGQQTCHGGLAWSSRADKHLGREAVVLKIDEKDDTVLVETVGPCECKIWYPRRAVEPIHNPDLSFKASLAVNTRVECRMDHGWLPGIVNEVLWNGPVRKGPIPYTVTLDDGRSVNVPNACLIRPI